MNDINSIIFLHLSDIHLNTEKDIKDEHIVKIVDSIKRYKETRFNHIVIIVSGDITQSGTKSQFLNAKKLFGSLIAKLKREFKCQYTVLVVPGNHDVSHGNAILTISELKMKNTPNLKQSNTTN